MTNNQHFSLYTNFMDTPSSILKRFRLLRWKLMLSYTALTVGAILLVGLFAAIGGYFWLDSQLHNTDLPYQLIESVAAEFVVDLRPMLNQSPSDQENISSLLVRIDSLPTPILLDAVPIAFEPGDLRMIVVDSDGIILGSTTTPILDEYPNNEILDSNELPQLVDALEAALAGQIEPLESNRSIISDDIVITAPVWNLAEDQVLGALILSYTPPTAIALLGEFAATIVLDLLMVLLLTGLIGIVFGLLFGRTITNRLEILTEATQSWSQGDFTVYVDDPSEDELGQLASRLNNMARQLQHLLDTRTQLMVVEERNRLARDLHDSAKQQAFAAAAQISAARKLLQQDQGAAESSIKEAEHLIDELRKELTILIEELRPAALEDKGLATAARDYAEEWSRQNKVELQVNTQNERPLPLDVEQTIFRIIQEALANVARHSRANNVEIGLIYNKLGITCLINDDGLGFASEQKQNGFGIRSMQERARAIGSTLYIESSFGKGTSIKFTVVVNRSNKKDMEITHG